MILSELSEIKSAIIGDMHGKRGLITKIDELETRVSNLETIKNKGVDKIVDFLFKVAGSVAMGYVAVHMSGIIK